MSTTTRRMTADELLLLPEDGYRYELIDGELIRMSPTGFEHSTIMFRLGGRLNAHVEENDLGVVCGGDVGVVVSENPDTVIAPDLAFISKERIPAEGVHKGYLRQTPDLVAEIISPSEVLKESREKAERWLAEGARMVWLVNPRKRTVTVYRPAFAPQVLAETDELDGLDVVSGFRCAVAKIFP
ncbi:MAG TPA: Uma2 family endonuclease [Pyrinomonadaceae bacterium]|nr:Uma2 family endonuclease [Pyrinomonadaceae bacterium]